MGQYGKESQWDDPLVDCADVVQSSRPPILNAILNNEAYKAQQVKYEFQNVWRSFSLNGGRVQVIILKVNLTYVCWSLVPTQDFQITDQRNAIHTFQIDHDLRGYFFFNSSSNVPKRSRPMPAMPAGAIHGFGFPLFESNRASTL